MIATAYFALGAVTGMLQAMHLRKATREGSHGAQLLLRFVLVGAALLVSALGGHLLACTAGWGLAFLAAVVVLARRWT